MGDVVGFYNVGEGNNVETEQDWAKYTALRYAKRKSGRRRFGAEVRDKLVAFGKL
jgi:hypothetical protein